MSKPIKASFSPEFRLEAVQLVVDDGRTLNGVVQSMDVGYSTLGKWVMRLREEREGIKPKSAPIRTHEPAIIILAYNHKYFL